MSRKFVGPKRCIGPSKLASILGMNRWCSREQLKAELEQGSWQESNPAIEFGIKNEALAIKFYEHHRKLKVNEARFERDLNGRLVGKADGLVGVDGGLEVKCHNNRPPLDKIPLHYLVQIVAYMALYQRQWWDFMSCGFKDGRLDRVKIIRVYWCNHQDTWNLEWLPQIEQFIEEVQWAA